MFIITDPTSTGKLFYEYVRIKTILEDQATTWEEPFFWLYENTFHMERATRLEISRCIIFVKLLFLWHLFPICCLLFHHHVDRSLGCHPVVRDASDYLPVVRRRCFWGNLPRMQETSLHAPLRPNLGDLLAPYRSAAVSIVPTLTTSSSSQRSGLYAASCTHMPAQIK